MSGESQNVKSAFIPAPIDGLNLIANPTAFLPTEARELQNYLVYDWGIRERGIETLMHSVNAIAMYPFHSYGAPEYMLLVDQSKTLYLMTSPGDTAPTAPGGLTPSVVTNLNICSFNKKLYLFNEVDIPLIYDIPTGGGFSATSFTGPTGTGTTLAVGWNYKHRLYALEGVSGTPTKVWYPGVGAIAGAMSSIDFGEELYQSNYLLTGLSWGYNQGTTSEELFVLIGVNGEVLFYSGDWPAASNWQLIGRGSIPTPTGRNCLVKYGQEVLISTIRGVIPLSKVFAGLTQNDASYYSTTRKLGSMGVFADKQLCIDPQSPFLYGSNSSATIYAQNYERGAWSSLAVTYTPSCLAAYGGYLFYGSTSHGTHRIETSGNGENTGLSYSVTSWKTPFLDFRSAPQLYNAAPNIQRQSKLIRVIGQDLSANNRLSNTAWTRTDFVDAGATPSGQTDVKSTTTTAGVYAVQELAPPGVGRRLSYCLKKTPTGERNEVYGFEAFYTEGGVY